jgi:hypothetical protein
MVKKTAATFAFAALLLGGVTPAPVQAQGGATGRVSGVVTDSATGQPLQAVQLFLSRGTTRLEARSSAEGRYLFPSVPAGTYGLEAIRLGYRRVLRANIAVAAGQTLPYDLKLAAAALNLQAIVTTGVVDPASGTRVPFSVGRVAAEDAPVPATNALETIQGKIAGVSVIPAARPVAARISSCARPPPSASRTRRWWWSTASFNRSRSMRLAPICSPWTSRASRW